MSIHCDLTDQTNGDKTEEEQENLHHSESEEMRHLRAKIAQLEGAKGMGSSTVASFEVFSSNGNESDDNCPDQIGGFDQLQKKFELKDIRQMCMITKLENKALQAELAHHRLLMDTELSSMRAKITEMEQKQQKKVDQLAQQQNDQQTELERMGQKQSADSEQLERAQEGILMKIDQLAKQVTDSELFKSAFPAKFGAIENFIGVLKDRFGNELLKAVHPTIRSSIAEVYANPPQNCWDVSASHNDLEIFGPECLMVHYKKEGNEDEWPWRVVFSKFSSQNTHFGVFYYEVKVLNMKRHAKIGIATKELGLDKGVGEHSDSFGYVNYGAVWTNGTERKREWPTFARDDVVGCGINLITGRLIFTKNGQQLDTADLFAAPNENWFPCVALMDAGDLINANFGPNFKFDLSAV